jgi:hypothetical protein
MKVYRLEHPIAGGPYQGDFSIFPASNTEKMMEMGYSHSSKNGHPGPITDELEEKLIELKEGGNLVLYGCPSKSKLMTWFRGYYLFLRRLGYEIKVYEVEKQNCILGKSGDQCIFIAR